jgi:hypothetical protein
MIRVIAGDLKASSIAHRVVASFWGSIKSDLVNRSLPFELLLVELNELIA